jgi:hypothetical protein
MFINDLPDDRGQENRTAILIVSCRRFEQVWDPFFTLFRRFWHECPYEINFATDSGTYSEVTVFNTDLDLGWGSICLNALKNISAERIIMFQEDFLIKSKVNNTVMRKLVKHAHDQDIGCLRLGPCPGPTGVWHGTESLGLIGLTDPYRVSLQLAIWKKTVLMTLVREGDNPQCIERKGPQRVKIINEPFVSVWRESETVPGGPIPYIITAVVNGVWQEDALELLRCENISMNKITRIIPRSL